MRARSEVNRANGDRPERALGIAEAEVDDLPEGNRYGQRGARCQQQCDDGQRNARVVRFEEGRQTNQRGEAAFLRFPDGACVHANLC